MLNENLSFILEVDRLKSVQRQSKIIGQSRAENSAEHSWHLAVCALVLAEPSLDIGKILKMLLIHDLVEIDAGDFPIHSEEYSEAQKRTAEQAAAERIFGLLPDLGAEALKKLWEEFEEGNSKEARFARAMDRLQPLLLNIANGGGTWVDNNVDESNVGKRYGPAISDGSEELWSEACKMVKAHFSK